MKKENLERAQKTIEQTRMVEYVLERINNSNPDCLERKFDWEPAYINTSYVQLILRNLTDDEEKCLSELKGAMTIILKKAAERTLAELNNEITEM